MEKIEDKEIILSKTIDFLRFPLALAVVFIHAFGQPSEYVLPNWNEGIASTDIYNMIRITFSHALTHIAVPVFFFISGFLFFYKVREFNLSVYKNKISKRFKTLVIPYLLWNIIYLARVVCEKTGEHLTQGTPLSSITEYFASNGWFHIFWDMNQWSFNRVDWLGNTLMPMSGPSILSLWFLRNLILITLFTPLIYFLVKKLNKYLVWILAFCYISNIFPQVKGLDITTVFFFTSGAFFSITRRNFITVFNKYQSVILLLAVISLIGTVIYDGQNTLEGQYAYPFYILFGSISAFNIGAYLIRTTSWEFPSVLPQSSFFIYAIHGIFVLSITKIICNFIFLNPFVMSYLPSTMLMIINYLVTPLLTTFICVSIYILMGKFTPRLLSLLTGDRKRS